MVGYAMPHLDKVDSSSGEVTGMHEDVRVFSN